MTSRSRFACAAAALLLPVAFALPSAQAATLLYAQDFESPNGFVNDGGDVNINRTINDLYSGQPAGFTFAQANTVETLRVGGNQAFGGLGFVDPAGIAGRYVVGMLSSVQNDLLGLSFNIGSFKFLNFRLDISSIDLGNFGGPFVPPGGVAPVFRFSLLDNPTGAVGLGGGALLSSFDATGTANPVKNVFDWTNVVAALDATGNTNGNVTLRIDLLSGGYAAMDNFFIAASDVGGEVPGATIPLPPGLALMAGGALLLGAAARRSRRT